MVIYNYNNKTFSVADIRSASQISSNSIAQPWDVVWSDYFIYVSVPDLGTVNVLDRFTKNVITTINIGSNPLGLYVDNNKNRLYIANGVAVTVVNTLTNSIIRTISIDNPIIIRQNPVDNNIYILSSNDKRISMIDGGYC